MKKVLKILGIAIGILVLAVVVLVLAAALFIDPNDYKDRITQAVKAQTGRELTIGGDIGLSFFPWLGVEMEDAALSNAKGFGPEPFAKIDRLGIKVKLLPVFRREVVVDRILLDRPVLNLARNKSGRTNWDDLVGAQAAPGEAEAPAGPALRALTIGAVDISNGELTYQDMAAGETTVLRALNLRSSEFVAGQPVDVDLGFELARTGTEPVPVNAEAQVILDPDQERLNIRSLRASVAALTLTGSVQGEKVFSAPRFEGRIDVPPFNARELLARLGAGFETADPKALTRASLASAFTASGDAVSLTDLKLGIDDSTATGALTLGTGTPSRYRFDLAIDRIDVDRYLPAPTASRAAKGAPAAGGSGKDGAVALPLDTLRALDARGTLRIGTLKAFGLRSTEASTTLAAKGGLITLSPSGAKLYGGTYKGSVALDVRGKRPQLAMDERLSSVQLGPFLKDADLFTAFEGVGNVSAKLKANGLTADDIKSSLSGVAEFSVKDGVLRGIDLRKIADQIENLQEDKSLRNIIDIVPSKGDATTFSRLGGSATLVNGTATNDDLIIHADPLKVTGKGKVDLASGNIDYRLFIIKNVPLKITGTLQDPKYGLEIEEFLKQRLKEEGIERLNKELEKRGLPKLFR